MLEMLIFAWIARRILGVAQLVVSNSSAGTRIGIPITAVHVVGHVLTDSFAAMGNALMFRTILATVVLVLKCAQDRAAAPLQCVIMVGDLQFPDI